MKISAIIIAKNEKDNIRDCIENLSFCDEIIVIDNGSEDNTAKIAESLGAKVFINPTSNFSDSRNLGFKQANFDWVLYIDADERCDEILKEEILKAVKNDNISAYFLRRKNFYLGNHEWPHIEKMLRFFKKNSLKGWEGEIHETPKTEGATAVLNGFLIHRTHKDLKSMVEKTASWSTTEAYLRLKANHPKMSWWRFPRVMLSAFLNSYILQGGYKAKGAGLIESIYQSFSIFITYAKLWELQNRKNETIK